jgi:hypothetical protein
MVVDGLILGLLDVVKAVIAGLPHLDPGAGHRAAIDIGHAAAHNRRVALAVEIDVGAIGIVGRAGDVEGPQNGVGRGARRAAVVDRVDQHRHPENIGQQDEFLTPVAAHMARPRQEGDALLPFLMAWLDLFDEGVEVADQRAHHRAEPFVLGAGHARVHHLVRAFFVEIARNLTGASGIIVFGHRLPLRRRFSGPDGHRQSPC